MSLTSMDEYPFRLPNEASSIISRFGFSQKEASVFYGVRLDTVKKWLSGKMQMPDDLMLESYAKLQTMTELAELVAAEYCHVASGADDGERNVAQYISLPTQEQMFRGFMPVSKGFYDNFFADVAARSYAAPKDQFCYVTPCEPSDEIGETNFWVLMWVANGLAMERCIEREDEILRFDVDFYEFLETTLREWKDVNAVFIDAFKDGRLSQITLEMPYVPDFYGEVAELTAAEIELAAPSVRLSFSVNGAQDFSDIATEQIKFLHFIDDSQILPMLESHEGPDDADLNATNENIAAVLKSVFGSRDTLIEKAKRH